ncbi:uncharacterized protein LOC5507101 [Nematostella vectensis]|uniref:uncharacterized protein LOC5507101 n=1 Tax=Nematostella vectensis TaxID=45351 RepID=UPI00207746C4|nr:uncharacterized protein LOC5507101 [Nematostella vectensis]
MAKTKEDSAPERESREGCCNCLWLVTSCEGLLKLLQLLATFLSFVIICGGLNSAKYKLEPKYDFMVFVGVTAFVFVGLHIILRMIHCFEKLPGFLLNPMVGAILCTLAFVAFVIASSIVYAYSYNWDTLLAAASCGFISAGLFLFEAILMFIRYKRGSRSDARETTALKSPKTEKLTGDDKDVEKQEDKKKEEEPKTAEELGFPP